MLSSYKLITISTFPCDLYDQKPQIQKTQVQAEVQKLKLQVQVQAQHHQIHKWSRHSTLSDSELVWHAEKRPCMQHLV